MSAVLETRKLCKRFGALTVAENIDFRLEAGARHALIGPNGAGKTTFVNMLTGRLAPPGGPDFNWGGGNTGLRARARGPPPPPPVRAGCRGGGDPPPGRAGRPASSAASAARSRSIRCSAT